MARIIQRVFQSRGFTRLQLWILGVLALGGAAWMLYITTIAPWAYSDSAAYIATARNIAAGRGIVLQDTNQVYSLLPLHAPLYPLTLSLPVTLGAGALQTSRWLNAMLFGLTIFLSGWVTHRFTRSLILAIGTAGLFGLSYETIVAFSGAMAEGLFIFFGFSSLVLIALALQPGANQNRYLLLGGIAAGLAVLARYTGLSIVAAGGISILILNPGRFSSRVKKSLIFGLPAGFLAVLWLVPVYLSTHTFGSRQVGNLSGLSEKLGDYFPGFWEIIGGWLPYFNRGNHIITPLQKLILAGLILVVLTYFSIRAYRKSVRLLNQHGLLNWIFILLIFCAAYITLHVLAFISAAAQPDINGRLLLPIFCAGIFLAAAISGFLSRPFGKAWFGGLVFAAMTLVTLWYFHGKVETFVFEMHNYGQGYSSLRWMENPIFEVVSDIDDTMPVYSNNPALVLLYTDRFPKELLPDPAKTAYDLSKKETTTIILFHDAGKLHLGEYYENFLDDARLVYQTEYQNDEGMILTPR